MSHFCNFYSIKMINKGIELETNAMVESARSGTPRPVIGSAGSAPVPGQDALCSQDTPPARDAGRHSRRGLILGLAGGNPQDEVLVLHWMSTLRAHALDVHVKLLLLAC